MAVLLTVEAWSGRLGTVTRIVPEGFEDVSLETTTGAIHIQVKSRRKYRGHYALGEFNSIAKTVASAAVERSRAGVGSRTVLLLERPVDGVSIAGWEEDFDFSQVDAGLLSAIGNDFPDPLTGEPLEYLARWCDEPRLRAIRLVSRIRKVPDVLAEIIVNELLSRLKSMSDGNYERKHTDALGLEISSVDGIFEAVLESVDVERLEEAARFGVMHSIDWDRIETEATTSLGVHIGPQHAVAGVLLPRPDVADHLAELVDNTRLAVVAGPSGSGKSAIIFQHAYETRASTRWQMLTSLVTPPNSPRTAVEMLLSRLRSLRPQDHSPVGVLVDDAGSHDPAVLNALLRDLSTVPNVAVVISVREEDRSPVPLLATFASIQPRLDEAFAESFWRSLRDTNQTEWLGWREPFERANGLLLEYSNLLTSGETLQGTITSQILAREQDSTRETELDILRLLSVANQYGVSVESELARSTLGTTQTLFDRSIRRLIDEHLIVSSTRGVLSALHERRSAVIAQATHPAGQHTTLSKLIEILDVASLPRLLRRSLGDGFPRGDIMFAAVKRFTERADLPTLIAVASSFRTDSVRLHAISAVDIMLEAGVTASDAVTTLTLARSKLDAAACRQFKPPVQEALRAFETFNLTPALDDLWKSFGQVDIDGLLADYIRSVGAEDPLVAQTLAALRGSTAVPMVQTNTALLQSMSEISILSTADLLAALQSLHPTSAQEITARIGHDVLLARLAEELPWIVSLTLCDGVIDVDLLFVDEATQPDMNGDVVEACRLALALAPDAIIANGRAVDVRGELVMLTQTFPLVDKRLARTSLPAALEVAENRASARAVSRVLAGQSLTGALHSESHLLEGLLRVLPAVVRAFADRVPAATGLLKQVQELHQQFEALPVANDATSESSLPGEMGTYPTDSSTSTALQFLVQNVVPALVRNPVSERTPVPVAGLFDKILNGLDSALITDRYRYLPNAPHVQETLNVFAALREIVLADSFIDQSERTRYGTVLRKQPGIEGVLETGRLARSLSRSRASIAATSLENWLKQRGIQSTVHTAQDPGRATPWPRPQLFILIDSHSPLTFAAAVSDIYETSQAWSEFSNFEVWAGIANAQGQTFGGSIYQFGSEAILPLSNREPPESMPGQLAPANVSSLWERLLRLGGRVAAVIALIASRGKPGLAQAEGELLSQSWTEFADTVISLRTLAGQSDSEYAEAILSLAASLGGMLSNDMDEALELSSVRHELSGVQTLESLSVLRPATEVLQDSSSAAAIVFGMIVTLGEIEDDFENADERINQIQLAKLHGPNSSTAH